MKEVRKFFDSRTGKNWLVNVRTKIVRDRDDNFAEGEEAARILRAVESRSRAQRARAERDGIRRDLGMVKVRGNLGGTFWE